MRKYLATPIISIGFDKYNYGLGKLRMENVNLVIATISAIFSYEFSFPNKHSIVYICSEAKTHRIAKLTFATRT